MRIRATGMGGGGRLAVASYFACALYLHTVVSLLCWATLPVIGGLTPTVIVSQSMAPRISEGDLVLTRKTSGRDLEPGAVITFDDPAVDGRLLTHRVIERLDDGSYATRGDANGVQDSTPVAPERIRGVGKVVVPAVGLPFTWVREGSWSILLLWLGVSALAAAGLRRWGRGVLQVDRWTSPLILTDERAAAPDRNGRPPRSRLRVAMATATSLLAVLGLASPHVATSHAAFAAQTSNPNDQFAAATSFCSLPGTHTLNPVADTEIRHDGTLSAGTDTALNVRAKNKNGNIRSLLRFDLPARAAGCNVAATLRLNLSAANTARILQVFNAPAAWDESSATWAAMPDPAATPLSNATPALGWIDIPVTDHVLAMYSGTNHGFLLKDQTEGAGGNNANTQTFASREAATGKPQLVLTFGTGASRPPAPTELAATATSSSRISLTWTDTATDETSYSVQRSLAGSGDWAAIATLAADSTSYTDTGLTSDTAYSYRVRSTNAQGDSAWSNIASATTLAPPPAPTAPTSTTATPNGVDRIDVAWTDTAENEDGFDIQRSPAGANTWTLAGTVGPNVTSFAATGLLANTSYDFRVRAVNNGGPSDWSPIATATTATCATLPAQTLTSVADTLVLQGSTTEFGNTTYFGVRAALNASGRSLVRFGTPMLSGGCSVTQATLRTYVSSAASPLTLQAHAVATSWTELGMTWTNQPASAGVVASITSDTTVGWREWNVTTAVGASGTGAPNGFMIRDSLENQATAVDQMMSPREGTSPPQLVVRFD